MEENSRDIQNIQNIQNNNSELLPLKKAAELFGYTEHHFGLLCRQGKLKNKRIGKKWFTTKEWVEEYFENFKNNTPVNNSEFISLKEASQISNYTQQHLGLLCRQGKLANKREGKKWLTTKKWLEEYEQQVKNQYEKNSQRGDNEKQFNIYDYDIVPKLRAPFQFIFSKKFALGFTSFAIFFFLALSISQINFGAAYTKLTAFYSQTKNTVQELPDVIQKNSATIGRYVNSGIIITQSAGHKSLNFIYTADAEDVVVISRAFVSSVHNFSKSFLDSGSDVLIKSVTFAHSTAYKTADFIYTVDAEDIDRASRIIASFASNNGKYMLSALKDGEEFFAEVFGDTKKNAFSLFAAIKTDEIPNMSSTILNTAFGLLEDVKNGFGMFSQNVKEVVLEFLGIQKDVFVLETKKAPEKETDEILSLQMELASIKKRGLVVEGPVVEKVVEKKVIEKTIERIIAGLTADEVDVRLNQLNNKILAQIVELKNEIARRADGNFSAIAITQRIDNLNSPTISTPIISAPSVSGTASLESLSTSGSASLNSLGVTNNATVGGNLTVSGFLTIVGAQSYSGLSSFDRATSTQHTVSDYLWIGDEDEDNLDIRAGVWNLTSTATTTVVMTNGLNFDSGTFIIDPNSNYVGIGTTSPYAKLSVAGNGVFNSWLSADYFTATSTTLASTFTYASTTALSVTTLCLTADCRTTWPTGGGGGGVGWASSTPDTTSIYFTGASNVGIGTSTPNRLLQLATNAGPQLLLTEPGAGNNLKHWYASTTAGSLTFGALSDSLSTLTEYMRINSSGNLGIGTTSPMSKLSVTSLSTQLTLAYNQTNYANFTVGNDGALTIDGSNNSQNSILTIGGGGQVDTVIVYDGNAQDYYIGLDDTDDTFKIGLGSAVGTTDYLDITSSGNIGIGTTSPYARLSVAGTGVFNSWLSADYFIATSTSIKSTFPYASTTQFTVSGTGASFLANTASSTFSGLLNLTNASTTQLTTFNNTYLAATGGNVGVGTTSPLAKLHVYGDDYLMRSDTSAASGAKTMLEFLRQGVSKWYFNLNASDSLDIGGKMVIKTDGNIGIGTTTPGALLNIASTLPRFYLSDTDFATNGHWFLENNAGVFSLGTTSSALAVSDTRALSITNTGNVGIGTTSPSTILQVAGDITPNTDDLHDVGNATYRWDDVYATNGTIQTSDIRLKENITDLNYGLNEILQLRPVTFTWISKPGKGTQLGLIAQEVQPIIPEVVDIGTDGNNTLGLRYEKFAPILIKGLQEIDAKVNPLANAIKVGSEAPEGGFNASSSPIQLLGHCVTGDTRLRRRRKKKSAGKRTDYIYDEVQIKDIQPGDEILSFNETNGEFEYSQARQVADMDIQEIYELKTKSGKVIRTTAEHPFLAMILEKKSQK